MDILRDQVWQFIIGATIAVAGIIAAIWIYRLQKHTKKLSYSVLASNELLTTKEEIRGKLKIF